MNITFLIGNGFDISLGIKSQYNEFYKWYSKIPSEKHHLQQFRDSLNKAIKDAIKNETLKEAPDEQRMWADFEMGLGEYSNNFTVDTVENYIDCVDDAELNIKEYLSNEQNSFDVSRCSKESLKSFQKSIWNFYDEVPDSGKDTIKNLINVRKAEDRVISFMSFNYTDTLERILNAIPETPIPKWKVNSMEYTYRLSKNVLHVHGTLDQFPVCGVNDESQIANKELLKTPQIEELLVKSSRVNFLGMMWQNQAENLIANSDIVCAFGTSLGATDAKWWRQLVQWLKANRERQIVLYWYEDNLPKGISAIKHVRAIEKAKSTLLSYTENLSQDEINALKKRIHVVINASSFLHIEMKRKEVPLSELEESPQEKMERARLEYEMYEEERQNLKEYLDSKAEHMEAQNQFNEAIAML